MDIGNGKPQEYFVSTLVYLFVIPLNEGRKEVIDLPPHLAPSSRESLCFVSFWILQVVLPFQGKWSFLEYVSRLSHWCFYSFSK